MRMGLLVGTIAVAAILFAAFFALQLHSGMIVSETGAASDADFSLTNPAPASLADTSDTSVKHLNIKQPIYAFSVTGRIDLQSNNSLARVILVDTKGNEYLVYEGSSLMSDPRTDLTNRCEETCALDAVTPDHIKIETVNATVRLTSVGYAGSAAELDNMVNMIFRFFTGKSDSSMIKEKQKEKKENQEKTKIEKLNKKIKEKGMRWTAGETELSKMTYAEKRKVFATKLDGTPLDELPDLHGFEYYTGGIFEVPDLQKSSPEEAAGISQGSGSANMPIMEVNSAGNPITGAVVAGTGDTGTLSITSFPSGASIYIDGACVDVSPADGNCDTTPATITLSVGQHLVRISAYYEMGYEVYNGTVTIQKGATTTLNVALVPNVPSTFDWRNRHGENWITAIKNQGAYGLCWDFTQVAGVEATTNLYFNQHINLDLPEWATNYGCSCDKNATSPCSAGFGEHDSYTNGYGFMIDETCLPYAKFDRGPSCCLCRTIPSLYFSCEACDTWNTKTVKTTEWIPNHTPDHKTLDYKMLLIKYGPLETSVSWAEHAVLLVGWKTDTDGKTIWIEKNSYGCSTCTGDSGYILDKNPVWPIYAVGTPITLTANPNMQINCVDKDNDGYCNWGISATKPANCPSSCATHSEEDCDDSKAYYGPFDSKYNCKAIGSVPSDTTEPIVGITSPKDSVVYSSTVSGMLNIAVSATDNVGVTKVEFYKDTNTVPFATDTTSPYQASLDTTTLSNDYHVVLAKAYDAAGNSKLETRTVLVYNGVNDNVAPKIGNIFSTGMSALITVYNIKNGTKTIPFSAKDDIGAFFGVSKVEFYKDSETIPFATDTSPEFISGGSHFPFFQFDITPTTFSLGQHLITAKAYDRANNINTSTPQPIYVTNVDDATPPTISISSPADGATISGTINIKAVASDNTGILYIQLSPPNWWFNKITNCFNSTLCEVTFDTKILPNGVTAFAAHAVDLNGNENWAWATVTISNSITNTAPVVSAGLDQTISLSQSASLDGTVTDDGLPNPPAKVTASWSKVSGPGTVTFANASAVDTTATFSAAGTYVIKLTASDSKLSASDTATITVTTATTGNLSVTSNPTGANAYVDSSSIGSTPITNYVLATGSHSVVLAKSGYNNYTSAFTITANQITNLGTITLTPVSTQTGNLTVSSNPTGASVYLDGVSKGISPITLTGVSVGNHTLLLTKSGYNNYTTAVTINAGQTATLSATLVPVTISTGNLSITSNPTAASAYVDGTYKGVTNLVISNLTAGSHSLILAKAGYNNYTATVTVTSGQTTSVDATLTSIPAQTGNISVSSNPTGASVYLDSVSKGVTPITISGVSVGSHTIKLTKTGYYDYTTTATVAAGQTASVSAALTPTSTTSFLDNFNRADSSSLGNNWQQVSGSFSIANNSAVNSVTKATHIAIQPMTLANQNISADFTRTSSNDATSLGVIGRYKDSNNYYSFYRTSGGSSLVYIAKVVNGVSSVIGSKTLANPTTNVPFNIKAELNGNTLKLYVNNALYVTATDTTFTSGGAGMIIKNPNGFQHKADNFVAAAAA